MKGRSFVPAVPWDRTLSPQQATRQPDGSMRLVRYPVQVYVKKQRKPLLSAPTCFL